MRSGSTCSSVADSPTASGWRSDIDVFVALEQAVEITRAIAQLFGELGNRENRGLARMRYLVQELGPEGFRIRACSQGAIHSFAPPANRSRSATAATTSGFTRNTRPGSSTSGAACPSGG